MSEIQSILLNKNKFNNLKKANKYIIDNGFKLIKIDITNKYYRYRQNNPNKYKKFRFKKINDKMNFIIGFK